jgi:hypothetical protein
MICSEHASVGGATAGDARFAPPPTEPNLILENSRVVVLPLLAAVPGVLLAHTVLPKFFVGIDYFTLTGGSCAAVITLLWLMWQHDPEQLDKHAWRTLSLVTSVVFWAWAIGFGYGLSAASGWLEPLVAAFLLTPPFTLSYCGSGDGRTQEARKEEPLSESELAERLGSLGDEPSATIPPWQRFLTGSFER